MKTDRDIANMENDIAVSQLHTKQSILDKAQDDLKNANGKVVDLRALQNDAKNNLGVSNFNLLQAMNSLLVAQAAKEQADKLYQNWKYKEAMEFYIKTIGDEAPSYVIEKYLDV